MNLDELTSKVLGKHQNESIGEVYSYGDGIYSYLNISAAFDTLVKRMYNWKIMGSTVFCSKLTHVAKAVQKNQTEEKLNHLQIGENVVMPTIVRLRDVITNVLSGEIMTTEVLNVLENLDDVQKQLSELTILRNFLQLHQFTERNIELCVDKIQCVLKLEQCVATVDCVLDVAKCLELDGNFTNVERIKSQVIWPSLIKSVILQYSL